ncbi:Basic-leucine zipper domain [Sesbania bispinosa]|nr:Basic-leucine zipper domain [Sesbania bispinosa]
MATLLDEGPCATSGVGDDGKVAQTDKGQADPPAPRSGCNTQPEMDLKRLERIIANRASAQRSRVRKIEYVAGLEEKAKTYQIEQHKLKLQMAIYEKERILQEVEIEKNKQDIKRLNELHKQLETEAREKMLNRSAHPVLNRSAIVQLMSNPNMNPFGFGPQFFLNSYQVQNGAGTSRMQTGISQGLQNGARTSRMQTSISQGPQNQSHMWTYLWNNGQRSTPDLN